MLNKMILQGRLIADAEMRQTASGTSVASVRIAWSEKYGDDKENKLFLNCTAWGKTADLLCSHFHKGKEINVEGKLTTRSWDDKEGNKRSSTEMTIEKVHFVGSKSDNAGQSYSTPTTPSEPAQGQFTELPPVDDGDLPF